MPQRAVKDFKYINTQMIGMLSDRTKMIEEQVRAISPDLPMLHQDLPGSPSLYELLSPSRGVYAVPSRLVQENFKKYKDLIPTVDRDKAKAEMGAWIADYFDDAGYVNWETQSQVRHRQPSRSALHRDPSRDHTALTFALWSSAL